MASIQRSIDVSKPMDTVVGYLKDFAHAEQWDPGTETCIRLDAGPLREGSTWRNVSNFLGRRVELLYRLERAEHDRLTFIGTNDAAQSIDDMTFAPVGDATRVTYHARIRLHGPARLADPLVYLALRGLAGKVAIRMQRAIGEL
jgi:carbon monoxide dehydrogenase subunit G